MRKAVLPLTVLTASKRMMLTLLAVCLVGMVALLFGVGLRTAETQTTATPMMQDLGTLGGSHSWANAINDSGQVVGYSYLAGDQNYHAFLYKDGKMTDLGTLPGGTSSEAKAINKSGQVVGWSYNSSGERRAFLYDSTNGMKDLNDSIPADLGWTMYEAAGINTDGKIAASSYGNTQPDPSVVCDYYSGMGPPVGAALVLSPTTTANYEVQDLGTLGGYYSRATGINDSSKVVGYSYTTPCGGERAFLYDSATQKMQGLSMIEARGINDSSQVVGYSRTSDPYPTQCTNLDCQRAFLYDSATQKLRDLGTLGGTPYGTFGSEARGINDSGKVVGLSGIGDCMHHWVSGSGPTYAFLYDSTNGMKDLNTLLPAGTGWTIDEATAINTDGNIAANGHKDGVGRHAVLVTQPSDPPADSQAPCPPAIDSPADGTITTDSTPEFGGWNTADSTKVTIYEGYNGQTKLGEATIGSPGTRWSFTPTTALSEGYHSITAKAEDAAGNTSGASETWWVKVETTDTTTPTDTTAPTVSTLSATSVTSTGVPLRKTDFKATFSEKMNTTTLNTSSFKLFKCSSTTSTTCTTQITNAPVTLSGDGLSATLNPFGSKSTSLQASTRYKVVVTTGAKDVAGNALDQNSSTTGNQQKVGYFTTGSS